MKTQYLLSILCSSALSIGSLAHAQTPANYPNKPVKMVVGFAPGGAADYVARNISDAMGKSLGQAIIVENKAGAGSSIAAEFVSKAAPDGYTWVMGFDGTMVINPHVFAKVGFDPINDYAPIGKIGDATLILVANPNVPAKNLQELIALSKKTPGGLSYGTSGTGSTPHIAGELFKIRSGAQLTHVPYKGGGQAMIDVMGGNIPLVYTAVAGAYNHVKSGKLKPMAVSSPQRASSLPDVPTFAESGVSDFNAASWVGFLAPAQTPAAIIQKLNTELNATLNDPVVRDKLRVLGIEATPGSPESFRDDIRRDLGRYGPVVKAAGIQVE